MGVWGRSVCMGAGRSACGGRWSMSCIWQDEAGGRAPRVCVGEPLTRSRRPRGWRRPSGGWGRWSWPLFGGSQGHRGQSRRSIGRGSLRAIERPRPGTPGPDRGAGPQRPEDVNERGLRGRVALIGGGTAGAASTAITGAIETAKTGAEDRPMARLPQAQEPRWATTRGRAIRPFLAAAAAGRVRVRGCGSGQRRRAPPGPRRGLR